MINETRTLETFYQYIAVPCSTLQERAIADMLTAELVELGFSVVEDNAGQKLNGTAGNLVATKKGSLTAAPTIMLTAHMDCVEPCTQITPILKDGLITSDGTTILGGDDKAGVTAIMEALRCITENNIPHGNLQVVFTIAEEGGVNGSKNMDRSLLKADMGFTFDTSSSPGRIVHKAPGQNKLRITVTGTPAHAGNAPEKGNSAIVALAKLITALPHGRIDEETTVNIGTISGGRATNIVAEEASLFMETRSRDIAKLKRITDEVIHIAEENAKNTNTKVTIQVLPAYDPFNVPVDSPTVALAKNASETLGFPVQVVESGGGSDASFFNAYGVPTVVLGVGMTNVHTKQECLLEEDLYNSARLAVQLIVEVSQLTK